MSLAWVTKPATQIQVMQTILIILLLYYWLSRIRQSHKDHNTFNIYFFNEAWPCTNFTMYYGSSLDDGNFLFWARLFLVLYKILKYFFVPEVSGQLSPLSGHSPSNIPLDERLIEGKSLSYLSCKY